MVLRYQWWIKFFLAFFWSLSFSMAKDLQPQIKFDTAEIEIGSRRIKVELAQSPEQQQKGLMYRESLEADKGMLFIFPAEEKLSFWMKNTYIDLSIAYIGKNLKIVDIQEMKATTPLETGTPPSYPSKKPAMYALEMPKHWFKKSNIKVGQSLKLPKNLK